MAKSQKRSNRETRKPKAANHGKRPNCNHNRKLKRLRAHKSGGG